MRGALYLEVTRQAVSRGPSSPTSATHAILEAQGTHPTVGRLDRVSSTHD
jgi:hypothetical protein